MSEDENRCTCSELIIDKITEPIQHAEGPHWDEENEALYFCDTFKATAYCFHPGYTENRVTQTKIAGRNSIGVIVPIEKTSNEFLVAADRYVYRMKWKADENNTGTLAELHIVDEAKPKNQFNDGKADINGRMWIGTLTREDDLSVSKNGGSLYRFDNGKNFTEIIPQTSISNGMGWTNDNKKFYWCDSQTRKIMVYNFNARNGTIDSGEVIFDLKDHPKLKGIPDGLTLDIKNNLWIALFGGHGVINVDGNTGKLIRYVKMPATYCTSVCFGGKTPNVLFVTTSRLHLNEEQLKKEPNAGAVFAIRQLGVIGYPPYKCIL